jgi:hypothetical protein
MVSAGPPAQQSGLEHEMRYSITAAVASMAAAVTFSAAPASTRTSDSDALTVHEWGTFTSIAGPDGMAVEWHPLGGPSDLPCFVERSAFNLKGALAGTVRMETPVLYFYAPRETTVDIRVRFHSGVITEWFPHASVSQKGAPIAPGSEGAIAWKRVKVAPNGADDFPVEPATSHYYTARHTNAAPVQAGSQTDKFLFYRGVGRLILPIAATIDADGRVTIRNQVPDLIDDVILFSNDHGRIQYQIRHISGGQTIDDLPVNDQQPAFELERMLVASGLYPEEASAMVDTWRDSWFEDGTRLFYVVPRQLIDSVLPLEINPPANDVARVFVARTELITRTTENEIVRALLANDFDTLRTYGRFLEAIGRRIIANAADPDRSVLEPRLQRAYSAIITLPDRCRS